MGKRPSSYEEGSRLIGKGSINRAQVTLCQTQLARQLVLCIRWMRFDEGRRNTQRKLVALSFLLSLSLSLSGRFVTSFMVVPLLIENNGLEGVETVHVISCMIGWHCQSVLLILGIALPFELCLSFSIALLFVGCDSTASCSLSKSRNQQKKEHVETSSLQKLQIWGGGAADLLLMS